MSFKTLQKWLCYKLIPHFKCLEVALEEPKNFQEYNYRAAAFVLKDFPGENLKEKVVLDLGCGDGGKTVFFASQGAKKVFGVDPTSAKFSLAGNFAREKKCQDSVEFVSASGTDLPFEDQIFDSIICSSVLEHVAVHDMRSLFKECHRVLRPGGKFLIRFHHYRSRQGTHLNFYIAIPWCQFLFDEQVLLDVFKECHYKRQMNGGDHFYASEKIKAYQHVWDINNLNRLTLKEFEEKIKESSFSVCSAYPSNKGFDRFFARLPVVREILANHYVYVLQKV